MEYPGVRGPRKRAAQTRRAWTSREEEVLVQLLKSLMSKGWRTDNSFRPGYLARLEESMKSVFPATNIRGSPHINSKITTWKRTFYILQNALSRSGVGFNESTYMIDCTDEVWRHVVESDKSADVLCYKQFPLYPAWVEFFGKDRANGSRAEDVLDAVCNMVLDDDQFGPASHAGDYRVSLDHIMEAHDDDSVCEEESAKNSTKPTAKKRKTDTLERMADMVGKLETNTNKIDTIATYIGYEQRLGEKRGEIDSVISDLPNLSLDDTLDVGESLVKDSDRLEYFLGLALEKKGQYVRRLLDKLKIS